MITESSYLYKYKYDEDSTHQRRTIRPGLECSKKDISGFGCQNAVNSCFVLLCVA